MKKQVNKIKTDNDNIMFIGYDGYEEYYQEINKTGGWSFMGLRPETEDSLRERQRDIDIEDYYDVPEILLRYIDYDAFREDMENEWYESHDVQAERINEDGETLYLGFGSGQSVGGYFKEHNINDYESYCNHFEIIGLTKKEFESFLKKYLV